jgi:hypothetical protein
MANQDRHGLREKIIFLDFAKACGIAIQLDSIEKRESPEPDTLCQIVREGAVAFEMVELTTKVSHSRRMSQSGSNSLLRLDTKTSLSVLAL